jgi:transcriptional regulator with XRE-family HTH domain
MDAKTLIAELLASGLTQKEIERRTGIDQSTVSGIYTGKRGKRVSYETMTKLQSFHDEIVKQPRVVA